MRSGTCDAPIAPPVTSLRMAKVISLAGTEEMVGNDSQYKLSETLSELASVNPEPNVRSDNPTNMSDLLEESERERLVRKTVTKQPIHDSSGKVIFKVLLPKRTREPVVAEEASSQIEDQLQVLTHNSQSAANDARRTFTVIAATTGQ